MTEQARKLAIRIRSEQGRTDWPESQPLPSRRAGSRGESLASRLRGIEARLRAEPRSSRAGWNIAADPFGPVPACTSPLARRAKRGSRNPCYAAIVVEYVRTASLEATTPVVGPSVMARDDCGSPVRYFEIPENRVRHKLTHSSLYSRSANQCSLRHPGPKRGVGPSYNVGRAGCGGRFGVR